jgi:pilus assembly protein Flp/PilA
MPRTAATTSWYLAASSTSHFNLRRNTMKFTSNRKQFGQGMMEYVIIVALIAVAAIGVYSMFGKTVRNQTAGLAKEISGKDSATQITAATTASGEAATRGDTKKGMGEYNKANDQN